MSDRTSGHLVDAVFECLMQKGIEAGGIAAGKAFSGDDICAVGKGIQIPAFFQHIDGLDARIWALRRFCCASHFQIACMKCVLSGITGITSLHALLAHLWRTRGREQDECAGKSDQRADEQVNAALIQVHDEHDGADDHDDHAAGHAHPA